jgi:hypothetical protein
MDDLSDIRDTAEARGASVEDVRRLHERLDGFLLAVEDLYDKISAIRTIQEAPTKEEVDRAWVELFDEEDEKGIRHATAVHRRNNPEALAKWQEEQERKRRSQPWISTDRSPRRRTVIIDGTKTREGVIVDPYGNVIGEDHQ